MSIAEAPVRTLTIQQWYDLYHDHEGDRCELVRGHAIMTPTEAFRNIDAVQALIAAFTGALDPSWRCRPQASVVIDGGSSPTMRVPDLTVMKETGGDQRWYARPSEVALVAEAVSASSMETDWVTKRGEYAAAGIPNYLIVDVRAPGEPRLWLFDETLPSTGPEPGAASPPRYADPTGDGLSVTIRIPGADPITIVATDLV